MQVAFVLPAPLVKKYVGLSSYHLCLAPLVLKYPDYADVYEAVSHNGEHVILDNGAAEGVRLRGEDLLVAMDRIHPTEVVLPDVLNDWRSTGEGCNWYNDAPYAETKPLVAIQGQTREEWFMALGAALSIMADSLTLGAPKAMKRWSPLRSVEIWGASKTLGTSPPWHLLGVAQSASSDIRTAPDCVRGIDMKQPIACALHGYAFRDEAPVKIHANWKLDLESDEDSELVGHNIKRTLAWAKEDELMRRYNECP